MPRKKTGVSFNEDTYAGQILRMTALAGEFPYRSLYLLGGSDRLLKRTVLNLRKEGYLNVIGSADLKTIRLSTKTFPVLKRLGFYDHYMFVSRDNKFSGMQSVNGSKHIWRNHRLAEAETMFFNLGAHICISEKPVLTLNTGEQETPICQEDFLFYSSREMKNADASQRYKYDFTRILGTLFSPGGVYAIYNTNEGRMKWSDQGEIKAKVLTEDIIKRNCSYKAGELNRSIIFSKDIMLAERILLGNGGKKDENGMEFLSFNRVYDHIHFIPLDGNGLYQVLLIVQKGWKDIILRSIFDEKILLNGKTSTVDADAFDKENHKYILSFLDGDIARLKRFNDAASQTEGKQKFEVVCFDWQEEFISSYMHKKVTVTKLTQEQLSAYIETGY